ncbi:hypothetical protein [Microlunatus antarcticus]|uniref:Uncharacterized protein n=1 Tax=Microlunatus antarcticus TaxID=53388 RepID=A0A7W5JU11_9ACTN|nr:hypothetical protein [Microlunatus antarcticus]MBB3326223.1 hypothetical protein [Microlunatus antarcticus]
MPPPSTSARRGGTIAAQVGELGPALASWNDFVGTAAADESGPTTTGPSLYEVAGLDPAAWIILSVDLDSAGPASSLVVYALDRRVHGVGSYADLVELGQQTGELGVTAFELTGPEARRLGASAFERLSVRLVARPFHDQRLVVQARHALPAGADRSTNR